MKGRKTVAITVKLLHNREHLRFTEDGKSKSCTFPFRFRAIQFAITLNGSGYLF